MNTESAMEHTGGRVGTPAVVQTKTEYSGDTSDILIPRIYGAQKTSKIVESGNVRLGQLVRSTNAEVLGGLGAPIPIIPLKQWKTWMTTDGGKFVGEEPYSAANANYTYEFERNGKKFKRERMLNFYVLLPADIAGNLEMRRKLRETGEMPDKITSLVPCQIGFKSTSYKAGRMLATHFAQMEDLGAMPYMRFLNLDTELGTSDKGKYTVLKVSEGGAIKDKEQLAVCQRWFQILKTTAVQVDELDEEVIEPEIPFDGPQDF